MAEHDCSLLPGQQRHERGNQRKEICHSAWWTANVSHVRSSRGLVCPSPEATAEQPLLLTRNQTLARAMTIVAVPVLAA